ncbi:MAG: hypothetical protein KR126chlam2_01414 [Chlamydiae bacterium]|nr:hypothetical protein [Chlamydiota bacterium]
MPIAATQQPLRDRVTAFPLPRHMLPLTILVLSQLPGAFDNGFVRNPYLDKLFPAMINVIGYPCEETQYLMNKAIFEVLLETVIVPSAIVVSSLTLCVIGRVKPNLCHTVLSAPVKVANWGYQKVSNGASNLQERLSNWWCSEDSQPQNVKKSA